MATDYKQYNYPEYSFCGESFARTGCGPCSVADIVNVNPIEIANWMTTHGYASTKKGTIWGGINACLTAYNAGGRLLACELDGRLESPYFEAWKDYIKTGHMGILLMHAARTQYWTHGGHYISIVNYDADTDRYLVYDPASVDRTGWHPFSDFIGDICNLYTSSVRWNTGGAYTLKTEQIYLASRGALVLLLQEILFARGFYSRKSGLDGIYGSDTYQAVLDYQRSRIKQGASLILDGVCGPATWSDLLGMPGDTHELKQIQIGCTGVDVLLLQEILTAYGYYNGQLDRSYGSATMAGVRAAQRRFGLAEDGICGPKTWKALLTAREII